MIKLSLLFLPLLFSSLSATYLSSPEKGVIKRSANDNIKEVYVASWDIFQGQTSYLYDGDDSSYVWFNSVAAGQSAITFELKTPEVIRDFYIVFGGSSTDWLMQGSLYSSSDLSDPEFTLVDNFVISEKQVVHVKANNSETTYFKLIANLPYWYQSGENITYCWVQIAEIGYNSGYFDSDEIESVSLSWYSGIETDTMISNMFDGDDSTYTRLHRPENGEYIAIKFRNATEISSARLKYYEDEYNDYINEAKFQYSNDGENYSDFDDFSAKITFSGDWGAKYLDVRDNPVTALYLRFLVVDHKGWTNIADFSVNTIPNNYLKLKFASGTYGKIDDGNIANIFDNSSSTQCWLNGNLPNVVVDLLDPYKVTNINLQTGKASDDNGDFMTGVLEYSLDGTSFTSFANHDGYNLQTFSNLNFVARYIRITNNNGGWTAIRIINVTKEETKVVSQSGMVFIDSVNSNPDLMVDGDLNYAYWTDWHCPNGAYVQVQYSQPQVANNIVFLQEGYITTTHGTSGDHFAKSTLSWSLDGETWNDVETFNGETNILYTFGSPVTLKYIRMTSTYGDLNPTGVCIREFDVNFAKVTIDSSFISSNVAYNASSYKGYDLLPYASGVSASYKNLRTNVTSSSVPTEISKYEVTVTTDGNDIYNACDFTKVMTVNDSANNFKSDFESILDNGSVCTNIEGDKIQELIYRYDNCLDSTEKASLDAMTFEDSDGNDMLVKDAIEYARHYIASISGNSAIIKTITDDNSVIVSILVSVLTVAFVGVAIFYFTQRKSRQ